MSWIMILFIWLVAPFAELGIIIWLLIVNDRYKGQIQDLERAGMRYGSSMTGRIHGVRSQEGERTEPAGLETARNQGEEIPFRRQEEEAQEPGRQQKMPGEQEAGWTSQMPAPEEDQRREAHIGQNSDWQREKQTERENDWQKETRTEKKEDWQCEKNIQKKILDYGYRHLGMLSLILGVVLIVLAGLIFATTTWHILPDIYKVFFVLAGGCLFFGASFLAQNRLQIRRTSNAFYILGSIFLFLSVLAAAYFELLGSDFILAGSNRWKVLWVGSIVTVTAFLAGLKRFHDRIYTQASLWGMSISMFFLVKTFLIGWSGFIWIMMIYSSVLILLKEYLESRIVKNQEKQGFGELLLEGFHLFAPIHFLVFGIFSMWHSLLAVCRVWPEGFTVLGVGAMGAMTAGICILERGKEKESYSWMKALASAQTILYAAGWVTDDAVFQMAAVNLAFLAIQGVRCFRKEISPEKHSLFLDICGCGALLLTLAGFYMDADGRTEALVLCLAAFAGYYVWFYKGSRQWPHLVAAIGILPLPYIARSAMELTMNQLGFGVGGVLLASGALARYYYPIVKEDDRVEGRWRVDWFQIFSIWTILFMAAMGDERWCFAYILLAAVYFLQYTAITSLKKPALFASACFLALACWQQPFLVWPEVLRLEMALVPAVLLLWVLGAVWDHLPWISWVQHVSYITFLLVLCADALLSGLVWDAIILEGICLAIFLWAQAKARVWWGRFGAAIILGVALFMTRSFWLSVSWWVYLLAAGISLMIVAGIIEKKR